MATYFDNLRIFNAENFKKSIDALSSSANLYLTIGKSDPWVNDVVPNTVANVATEISIWNNMIGAKKITSNDTRHAIRRIGWATDIVFDQYDDRNNTILDGNTDFYTVTDDWNVYKCLDNRNGSNSTIKPTSVDTSNAFTLNDGYTWKYMYTISDEEIFRYTTESHIPVKNILYDEGSLQWDVQQNAVLGKGAIYSIKLTNGGSNYTNTDNIIVTIIGNGTGATATATINANTNTVNAIVMSTFGLNYTDATVAISGGGGSNATARAIMSPPGGHGSNPVYELGGSNIFINTRIIGNQGGKLPADTSFRQISILKDPVKYNTSIISSNTVVSQTYDFSLYNYAVGVGVPLNYEVDEIVYQGISSTNYTFKGRVVDWDSTNNIIRLAQTDGTPNLLASLIGVETTTTKLINSTLTPELNRNTGQILYYDNFAPIIKDVDQTEDLKILIKF